MADVLPKLTMTQRDAILNYVASGTPWSGPGGYRRHTGGAFSRMLEMMAVDGLWYGRYSRDERRLVPPVMFHSPTILALKAFVAQDKRAMEYREKIKQMIALREKAEAQYAAATADAKKADDATRAERSAGQRQRRIEGLRQLGLEMQREGSLNLAEAGEALWGLPDDELLQFVDAVISRSETA
jgi:hypothetical protein